MHRVVIVLLLAGCGGAPPSVPDPPRVEALRLQISKARNAIAETRAALERARGTDYVPELRVRLGELLSEEAKAHFQVARAREQDSKALNVPQVRVLKEQAIAAFQRVLRDAPDSGLVDRALYNIGQEQRELGDYEAMRKALRSLIERRPNSPLVAEALLILGDDHFDRGEMKQAGQAYQQITEGPPSRTVGLAWYKLGWVQTNLADCKKALAAFEKAIDATRAASGSARRQGLQADIDVRREALVDMTYCFSRERKPATAVPYLRARAAGRAAYVAALEKVADRYGIMDQADGALPVVRELLRRGPDAPQRLEDARTLHAALRKLKRFDAIGDDVALMIDAVLRHIRRPGVPQETRARLRDEFESLARDLATRAQQVLLAGKEKAPTFALQVGGAYRAWLDAFPGNENALAMTENLADVLVLAGRDFEAGRWFIRAAALRGEGKQRRVALYDAVVHFQAALDADEAATSRVQRVVARSSLRRAGSELIAGELSVEQARKVKFAIARTFYDQGAREAMDRLQAVALEFPGTPEGDAAAELALDAYATRNDFLGLIGAGRRLMAQPSVSAEVKARIGPVITAAEQQQLDELSLSAAAVDGADAGAELMNFAAQNKGTPLGERALLNAFLAARAGGDSAALYALGDQIRVEYPKSEQVPGLLATLGRTAAGRFELDRAVAYFGQGAATGAGNPVALRVAEGRLKAQLGDASGAAQSYAAALQLAKGSAQRRTVSAALADWTEAHAEPGDAIARLRPLAGDADPAVLTALGLAHARVGDVDSAEVVLQRVLESGVSAEPASIARAHYGQAEALSRTLAGFTPGNSVDEVTEFVTLVDVTEQGYLKAAREGEPAVTAAALGRLAHVALSTAGRLNALKPPSALTGAQAEQLKKALATRATRLQKTAADALGACSEQAWLRPVFHPAARACLNGQPPASDPLRPDRLKARGRPAESAGLDPLRQRISRNPEDVDALRALGEALLASGDPHTARLALARAVRAGGGAVELNLMGIAHYKAGDTAGALEAFAKAAAGGLEAARQNLAEGLRAQGLSAAAEEALRRWPQGRDGGARLGGGA